jgi:isoleucyl-tRNA synthetase
VIEEYMQIIKDEINVKEVRYTDGIENYTTQKLSINFQIVGKRLPQKMKEMIAASKTNQWRINEDKLEIAGETLNAGEFSITHEPDIEKIKAVYGKNIGVKMVEGVGLVVLDLTITPELEREGISNDILHCVQQARKDANFNVSDRVYLEITGDSDIASIVEEFTDLIQERTLSELSAGFIPDYIAESKLGDSQLTIKLKKL